MILLICLVNLFINDGVQLAFVIAAIMSFFAMITIRFVRKTGY